MLSIIGVKRSEHAVRPRAVQFIAGNTMRVVVGLVAAGAVSVCIGGTVWMMSAASPPPEKAQQTAAAPIPPSNPVPKVEPAAEITGSVSVPEAKPAAGPAKRACSNPNALGIGRVVEIDS